MNTLLQSCRRLTGETVLDIAWNHWTALGVAGAANGSGAYTVDPEALLLFSCSAARRDARLFVEMLDWLSLNGQYINVQRLQNLQKRYNFDGINVLHAIAAHLSRGSVSAQKWKKLSKPVSDGISKEPLLFTQDGTPLPVGNDLDDVFGRHGFSCGTINLRRRSRTFPNHGAATLLLRLRALFGISVRCEALALLAALEELHPTQAASLAGYSQKAMQNAFVEMSLSGALTVRKGKRDVYYRLTKGIMDDLLMPEGVKPRWGFWAPVFKALEVLNTGIRDPRLEAHEPLLQSSELRQLMIKISPYISEARASRLISDPSFVTGEQYSPVFFGDVERFLEYFNNSALFTAATWPGNR
jgi:hypothetical protein